MPTPAVPPDRTPDSQIARKGIIPMNSIKPYLITLLVAVAAIAIVFRVQAVKQVVTGQVL